MVMTALTRNVSCRRPMSTLGACDCQTLIRLGLREDRPSEFGSDCFPGSGCEPCSLSVKRRRSVRSIGYPLSLEVLRLCRPYVRLRRQSRKHLVRLSQVSAGEVVGSSDLADRTLGRREHDPAATCRDPDGSGLFGAQRLPERPLSVVARSPAARESRHRFEQRWLRPAPRAGGRSHASQKPRSARADRGASPRAAEATRKAPPLGIGREPTRFRFFDAPDRLARACPICEAALVGYLGSRDSLRRGSAPRS